MQKNRAIRVSLKKRIQEMFQTPVAGTFENAFHVYTKAQWDAAGNGTFTPVMPYLYLMDSFQAPIATERVDLQTPQVIVEIDEYRNRPFELGTRSGRRVVAMVQVFGKDRGQRDDLASYIVDYIGNALTIYDFSASAPSGVEVETAVIEDEKVAEDIFTPRLELLLANPITLGHSRVTFSFLPKL